MAGDFDEKVLRRIFRRFHINPRRIYKEGGDLVASLEPDAVHHIRNVLRLGKGSRIVLFDGSGKEYLCEIILTKPGIVKAKVNQTTYPETESALELILAQALVKEQAMNKILTSATELGVKKIIPVLSKRVVVKLRMREIEQKIFRWSKIMEESACLSGRVKIPEIEYPVEFPKLLEQKFEGQKIILWEKARGGEMESLKIALGRNQNQETGSPLKILLLVGPEGGFENEEAENAISAGFIPLGLGPRIIRAETASLAGISILQYLFGDLKKKIN